MKTIYLDYAAATPLAPPVRQRMWAVEEKFGNPSSLHTAGRAARAVLEQARQEISQVLHCRPGELIFTSSGTESINLALLGYARANRQRGRHLITTHSEHLAVLRACQQLENEGFTVTYLPVDKNGLVDLVKLRAALQPDTILVSIGYANNEIGTIQPIKAIAKLIRKFKHEKLKIENLKLKISEKLPVFHTDACQAAGALPLDVQALGVDLLSFNGSKIYGPKGSAGLFIRRPLKLEPLVFGGSQEQGLRSGTESPVLMAGLASALRSADQKCASESKRLTRLRDYFSQQVLDAIPYSRLNGDPQQRLPNNLNFSFQGVDGELLVLALDQAGIQVSTGSACSARSTGPSHVLRAIGQPPGWGNVRLTLGRPTKKAELDYTLTVLARAVKRLRR